MKIRLDKKMYGQAQRLADSKGMTFSRWVVRMMNDDDPSAKYDLPKLTRDNSVSVFFNDGKLPVNPEWVRIVIARAVAKDNKTSWPYRYDRSSLEAVIQLETILGRSCSYENAQAYIDRRIEERKEEIRVSEKGKRNK